jgi:PPK2 family polyphosphate:nucleotide phosphotransferase
MHDALIVRPGSAAGLSGRSSTWTGKGYGSAEKQLEKGVEALSEAQELLWASDSRALLVVFQAIDAAGKDSTIKHVMSGVNPQGVHVTSFKKPSEEELDHTYLWRVQKAAPERGRIGIFNRSHYEDVVVVRVHPGWLPDDVGPVGEQFWLDRYDDLNAFERHLTRNGTAVVKFFLHVSKAEQKRRFLARLDTPEKNWKFSAADVEERRYWKDYMAAYEDAIRATAAPHAPWVVVPADQKWFTRLVVSSVIVDALERLDLKFPEVGAARRAELEQARQLLLEG